MQDLKVVATTRIWEAKNPHNSDFPMWHPVGSNEYVIGYISVEEDEELLLTDVAEHVKKFIHMLEGLTRPGTVEVFSGYEVYHKDGLTHNEQFQLTNGDTIDFPADDITILETKGES